MFEFLGLHKKGVPQFLSFEPLLEFGYNIDCNYKPFLSVDRLQPNENYKDYYQRSFALVKSLANAHMNDGFYTLNFFKLCFKMKFNEFKNKGANITLIGHAGTLEACTRQMSGADMRPYLEFNSIG